MKKILSVLLILAMVFSMAACSSGNNNVPDTSDQNEPSSAVNEVPDSTPENDDTQAEDNTEPSENPSQDESAEVPDADNETESGSNILVAYFSRVGNIEFDPNVNLLGGLAVRGSNASSARSDVESWINNSGIIQ